MNIFGLFGGGEDPLEKPLTEAVQRFDNGAYAEVLQDMKRILKDDTGKLSNEKVNNLSKIILKSESREQFWLLSISFFLSLKSPISPDHTVPHLQRIGNAHPQELEAYVDSFYSHHSEIANEIYSHLKQLRGEKVEIAYGSFIPNTPPIFFILVFNLLVDASYRINDAKKLFKWRENEISFMKFDYLKENSILKQIFRENGKGCEALCACFDNLTTERNGTISIDEFEALFEEIILNAPSRRFAATTFHEPRRSSWLARRLSGNQNIPRTESQDDASSEISQTPTRRSSFFKSRKSSFSKDKPKEENGDIIDIPPPPPPSSPPLPVIGANRGAAPPIAPRPKPKKSEAQSSAIPVAAVIAEDNPNPYPIIGPPMATGVSTAASTTISAEPLSHGKGDHHHQLHNINNSHHHQHLLESKNDQQIKYPDISRMDRSTSPLEMDEISTTLSQGSVDNRDQGSIDVGTPAPRRTTHTPPMGQNLRGRGESRFSISAGAQHAKKFKSQDVIRLFEATEKAIRDRILIVNDILACASLLSKLVMLNPNDPQARMVYGKAIEYLLKNCPGSKFGGDNSVKQKRAEVLTSCLDVDIEVEDILASSESPYIYETVQFLEEPCMNFRKLTVAAWKSMIIQEQERDYKGAGMHMGMGGRRNRRDSWLNVQIDPKKLFSCNGKPEESILPIQIALEMKSWYNAARATQIEVKLSKETEREVVKQLDSLVKKYRPTNMQEIKQILAIFSKCHATFQATEIVNALIHREKDFVSIISMPEFTELQNKYRKIHLLFAQFSNNYIHPETNGEIPQWFIDYIRKSRFEGDGGLTKELKVVFDRLTTFYQSIKNGTASIENVNAWTNYKSFWLDVNKLTGVKMKENEFDDTLNTYMKSFARYREHLQALWASRDWFSDPDKYENVNPWDVAYDANTVAQLYHEVEKLKENLGFNKKNEDIYKSFVYFVEKGSQLFKGAMKVIRLDKRVTHAEHVDLAVKFLRSMLGNSIEKGFRLKNIRKIHDILITLNKGSVDREMQLVEEHFLGRNSGVRGKGIMSAALDLSICNFHAPDAAEYFEKLSASIQVKAPDNAARFSELANSIRKWMNQYEDPPLSDAEKIYKEFTKMLPGLVVHMITIFPLLLESEKLVEFLIDKFGSNDDDFQRTITMLRGNFQDDERATSILSSLHLSRSILSIVRGEFMDEKTAKILTVEKICNEINHYHGIDQDFSNLRNSIHHVEDAKSYLDQLKNDDTQSIITMIWSYQGRCTVQHSGGQEFDANDIFQRINFALSSIEGIVAAQAGGNQTKDESSRLNSLRQKHELLQTCLHGHKLWMQLLDTSYPVDEKFMFYIAPGFLGDQKAKEVGEKLNEDLQKISLEKERLSRKWYVLSNLSLQKFVVARNPLKTALDDDILNAITDCFKPMTKQVIEKMIDKTKVNSLEKKSGLEILLYCLSEIENKLVETRLQATKEEVEQLERTQQSWSESLKAQCRSSPKLYLLGSRQLKYILSNNLRNQGSSLKYFGSICDINIPDGNDRELKLEEVAQIFRNGDTKRDKNENTEPTKIINLGYAEGEKIPLILMKTLIMASPSITTANILWCNGNHTPADVENFLHRPGAVPILAFVVVRPDRLSLAARRRLMHLLSGAELKGGNVHLLFSDHEVEAAISKALRCEDSDIVLGQSKIEDTVPHLFNICTIMQGREQNLLYCVHGNIGDGKTIFIQDEMRGIKGGIPLRICVNEKFTSDSCSKLIINHIKKNRILSTNGIPLILHFDIADGESITNPISFYWKVMRDREYLNRSTIRPLEELEKFVFQFFILGFLIDDIVGEVMCLPKTTKVFGYFELPSVNLLNQHLHILRGLSKTDTPYSKGFVINVSDQKSRRPYISRDRDDDFAARCLQLIESKTLKFSTLHEILQKWEASLKDNSLHMESSLDAATVNRLIESKMPNWDKRSQRNVCSLITTRMSLLARYGFFHSKENDGEAQKIVDIDNNVIKAAPLIVESALRKFNPTARVDERNFVQVSIGGDENVGASFDLLQLRPPNNAEAIDFYEINEPQKQTRVARDAVKDLIYLSLLTPSELRNTIAPALGLGASSHVILDELQRQRYALTPDFALKLLTQCEYRDARSPVIYSGGTGVGKSEGAKLQSQLALAEGYIDIANEAKRYILDFVDGANKGNNQPFVDRIGGKVAFETFCTGFKKANINLGRGDTWDIQVCRDSIQPNVNSPCILLAPLTTEGNFPLKIKDRDVVKAYTNDTFVKVDVASNDSNAFIIKAIASREGPFTVFVKISSVQNDFKANFVSMSSAPKSDENPYIYDDGMKTKFADVAGALSKAADCMPGANEATVQNVKQECAKLLRQLLRDWITEHALVLSEPGKLSALQKLETIDFNNADECLKEIGKFGDKLRRPDLTFKICIHPSTTIEHLRKLVGRAVYRLAHVLEWLASKKEKKNVSLAQMRKVAVVFLDELNTSSFPGLMKQLILDRMLDNTTLVDLGKEEHNRIVELATAAKFTEPEMSEDCFGSHGYRVIDERFFQLAADGILFIGAINPPKKENKNSELTDKIEVLAQLKDDAVFNVTDLPEGLKRVVREFGDQDDIAMRDVVFNILGNINYMTEEERKDCCRLIMLSHRLITSYREGINGSGEFEKYDRNRKRAIAEMENTHSSIRNIWRTVKISNFFIDHPRLLYLDDEKVDEDLLNSKVKIPNGIEIRRRAFLTALGSAYYLQLLKVDESSIDLREDFGKRIDFSYVYKSWGQTEKREIPPAVIRGVEFEHFMDKSITSVFNFAKGLLSAEHATTTVLKEHIFSILICTQLKIPILIVGPPGCSKTLAYQLVASGLKTIYSVDKIFPRSNFKCLDESVYQCSELSTAQEIEVILKNAVNYTGKRDRTHPAVLLDEASLAPRALKAIHEPFDQANVACVVLSNLQLDAAKTNRCLYLRRKGFGDEFDDLKLLAMSSTKLVERQDDIESVKSVAVLEGMCKGYQELVKEGSPFKSTFHLRHFLYCVRFLAPFGEPLNTSPQKIAQAISRNFGGVDQQQFEEKIAKVFFRNIKAKMEERALIEKAKEYNYPPKSWAYDVIELIEESVKGTRYECGKEGFDPNIHSPRNVMLVVRGDGLGLLDMVLDKTLLKQTRSITVSSFMGDDDNMGREKVISDVAREMTEGNIIRLYNGEKGRVFSAFYDAFNMRFSKARTSWFVTVTAGSRSMSRQYDPKFRAIVVIDQGEYDRMRSEKSNMLPFLSRFEAHHVSPSSILQSVIGISRLRQDKKPIPDHIRWIQSAVDRTFELLIQGSGCFVGVGSFGQDALDTAIILTLTSSAIPADAIGKDETKKMVIAANKRLLQTGRPDALCLRTRVEWLPDEMIYDYVVEQEHFSLVRFLHKCKEKLNFVLMKSSVHLTNQDILRKCTPKGCQFIELDKCDKAALFESKLQELIRNDTSMIIITVNFSIVSYDQLYHVQRLVVNYLSIANARNKTSVIVLAHLSSDRFELGQLPQALFSVGWNTVFIDAVGDVNEKEKSEELVETLLHAFKYGGDRADKGKKGQNMGNVADDFVAEQKDACKRIRISRPINLPQAIKEKDLSARDRLTNPEFFIFAAYNQSKTSRISKSREEVFFLDTKTSAHHLFVLCCREVLDHVPENKHIEIITERAAMSTAGGNDGEPFEVTAKNAKQVFKRDTVRSILAAILSESGLPAFLKVAGGNRALENAKAFRDDLPIVRLTCQAAQLIKESNSKLQQVGVALRGFVPQTPFFTLIVNRINLHIQQKSFTPEKVKKKDKELYEVLQIMSKDQDIYCNFLDDLIRAECEINDTSTIELTIAKKYLEYTMATKNLGNGQKNVNADDTLFSLFGMLEHVLGESNMIQECKKLMWTASPLLEYPNETQNIVQRFSRNGNLDLKDMVFDEIYNMVSRIFVENNIDYIVNSLRAMRILKSMAKGDLSCFEHIVHLCEREGSCMLHLLSLYTAYCSAASKFTDVMLVNLVNGFRPVVGKNDPLVRQFGVTLKDIFKDYSVAWKAIEDVSLMLMDFDKGFFLPGGNCDQLFSLINKSKWSIEGKLSGNRECYMMRTLYAFTASNRINRTHFVLRSNAVLKTENSKFISPFIRDDEYQVRPNLEDSLYWMSYEDEKITICMLDQFLNIKLEDPGMVIRFAAAKDKIITQMAEHINISNKWNLYLDAKCDGGCQKITHHKKIAREILFAGEEGLKNAQNFLGQLRTDLAEQFLRQSQAILEDFGLTCLLKHRIEGNQKDSEYRNLLRMPFSRGGNDSDASKKEYKEYQELSDKFISSIVDRNSQKLMNLLNNIDEAKCYRYRAYLIVLFYENGLLKRQDISKTFISDDFCRKLRVEPEERKWYEALAYDLQHFPVNPLPEIRKDDLPVSYKQAHKNFKAKSVTLYSISCEPAGPMASLYIAILVTAFGANKERNHLWQRIFNIQQTANNIGPPMFRDHTAFGDVDCAYDLEYAAKDMFTNIDDRILHKCHVASVSWGCNALACALNTTRNEAMRKNTSNLCMYHGDQKTSTGMEAELVKLAGEEELAWRNQYLHVRSANFLKLLQGNIDAPNINPGMKSWPREIEGAFSVNVLDQYRQIMNSDPKFISRFPTIETLRQYEAAITQILTDVEKNSPRIVARVKDFGTAKEQMSFLTKGQEHVNKVKLNNPYRYGGFDPIKRYLEAKINGGILQGQPCGHLLEYIHHYKGAVKARAAIKEHGAKLYKIYRFLCTKLSGKLYVGCGDPRYSESRLVTEVLNAYADDELKRGNNALAEIARQYAKEIIIHYNGLKSIANFSAAVGCHVIPRPDGEHLIVGDAIGGVPDSLTKVGWIVKTLVDVGKECSKIANMSNDDEEILWKWDERLSIAHNGKDIKASSYIMETTGYNIIEFDCFVELHLPKFTEAMDVPITVNGLQEINRKIVIAAGGGLPGNLTWNEEDLIIPFKWVTPFDKDDESDNIMESSLGAGKENVDREEESRRDRIDMLDGDGAKLAKLCGVLQKQQPKYPMEKELEKKIRKYLESKGADERVRAYYFCPKLVEACGLCTAQNIEEKLTAYITDWGLPEVTVEQLWNVSRICVEIMLSRNSRFSDLDVVLQSGLVKDAGRIRRQLLLNITKKQASEILDAIKQLSLYLHEERVLQILAEDPRREIKKALLEVYPAFKCNENLLPDGITGSCLADYLLLLHDIASRLRLRSAKFGTLSDNDNEVGNKYSNEPIEPSLDNQEKRLNVEDVAGAKLKEVPVNADDDDDDEENDGIHQEKKEMFQVIGIDPFSNQESVLDDF